MTLIGLFLVGCWVCLLWYQMVHYLPAQRKIVGCRHTSGRVEKINPDMNGRPTSVHWFCNDCTFQHPLQMVRFRGLWKTKEDALAAPETGRCPLCGGEFDEVQVRMRPDDEPPETARRPE